MPVHLPLQPIGINLPAQPQDPPMFADVLTVQAQVDASVASPSPPTSDDAARADIYKTNVIMAHSPIEGVPVWFQPVLNAFLAMEDNVASIQKTLAQTRNFQLYNGNATPFIIVPFNNGNIPPPDLPCLVNAAAVRALTEGQSTAYALGYGLGHIEQLAARRAAIARAIGCTVEI